MIENMNGTHFSIMEFCQSFLLCSRRQQTKRFQDLSAKSILERILKATQTKKKTVLQSSPEKFSLSTPNLTVLVKGNSSLKPTISIKQQTFTMYQQSRLVSKETYEEDGNVSCENLKNENFVIKKDNGRLKTRRLKSFKSNPKFSFVQSFASCPNLHLINANNVDQQHSDKSLELFDTVDDFTTNLFLTETIIDEHNFDLVSISFDRN